MAIEIKNFKSNIGVVIPRAYLRLTTVEYQPVIKELFFKASVFPSLESNVKPIEEDVQLVNLYDFDYDGSDLIDHIESLLQEKMDTIADKTEEECQKHNDVLNPSARCTEDAWLLIWDYNFKRFISTEDEPSLDDEYIQAAKIFLGEE